MVKRFELVRASGERIEDLLSLAELGRSVGLHPEMLERFLMYGLIDPVVDRPEPLFEPAVIVRVRVIQRLRRDLGINLAGAGLAVELIERISALEAELDFYRRSR